jgi:Flp pilus assembly pilin Flp
LSIRERRIGVSPLRGLLDLIARLAADEEGQDLVEYGLLAAAVAATAFAVFPSILRSMGVMFQSWAPAVNNVWETPPPL